MDRVEIGLWLELIIFQLVWIGESLPAQNQYSKLLLRENPSPPLLSVPPSQLLPELEHLPAALPEAPWNWCLSLQPLGLDLCPSLLSLSPWGDRAALVYCSWGECMSPHSYICALQVLCCIVFTASIYSILTILPAHDGPVWICWEGGSVVTSVGLAANNV